MKKRWVYCAMTGILAAVLLAGCGDGSETGSEEKHIDVLEPIALAGTSELGDVQVVGESDETPEPEEGIPQNSGFEGLSVETEAAVLENLQNLKQNLELPEYVGEAIHLVSSEEWFAVVAGELHEGSRSYTIGGTGEASLSVQVGYDAEQKPFVNACYQEAGQILLLTYAKEIAWLLQTEISGGAYNGAFEKWQVNGGTGYILKETGTYVNGIVVGQYTKSEHTGGSGDVFDLWTNRDNFDYKTTELTYNEQGQISTTSEPTAEPPQPTTHPTAQPPQPTATPTAKPPQSTARPTVQPTTQPPQPTAQPTTQPPQPTAQPTTQPPQPTAQPTTQPPQPTTQPPQPTAQPTAEPPQPTAQPTAEPPQPTAEPPQPTAEPPQPPEGGDTDIEWSPDLM